MRMITVAAATGFAALAACEKEPDTLVVDPEPVNQSADGAAEMNRTTVTPIELGNGFDEGNEAGFPREQTTVVGNEADLPENGAR
ncbi:MAG: hypothetical protein ACK40O_02770 [Allosphingosinicella sp.]